MPYVIGAVLLVIGGLALRRRLQAYRDRELLSDDLIRQIEREGSIMMVDHPEPLDMKQIKQEEERFWEETAWDEPEEM